MDVYGYDPFVSVSAAWKISSPVHYITDLKDIFRTCDYITIHVPALKDTIGMVDAHMVLPYEGRRSAAEFLARYAGRRSRS